MSQEALQLSESEGGITLVKIHPTAIFGILNHFIRKDDRQPRVLGSLLGNRLLNGEVEITNSFGIPYSERTGVETDVFMMDGTYNRDMLSYHRRVNRKETLVGWYTTSQSSAVLSENSAAQYQFYRSQGCVSAVHLVVDTSLTGENIGVRAFVPSFLAVGLEEDGVIANMFREVRVELCLSPSEHSSLYHMVHHQIGESRWNGPKLLSEIPPESALLQESMSKLSAALSALSTYVDEVVDGRREGDPAVGAALAGVLGSVRVFRPEEQKALIDSKVQDMLMVTYLTTLVKSQLVIAEKLLTIL